MAADDQISIPTERPTVFTAGVMELEAGALILAPLALLIAVLVFPITRPKKP